MKSIAFDKSSNLLATTYEPAVDEKPSACDVFFVGATVYRFFGIPEPVFEAWEKAESAGKYFHANIRGKYTSVKLECRTCEKRLSDPDVVLVQTEDRVIAYCKACYEKA